MVPDWTSRPFAVLLVIPEVVVIPLAEIKFPPVMSIADGVIAPEVVEPEVIFRVPVEFEILTRLLEPVRLRLPELAILAPVTFWRELLPEEEISYSTEPVLVIAP